MPEHIRVSDLAARKRALVEASEAQREVLLMELDELRLSAVAFQRKLKLFSTAASVLGVLVPLAGSVFRFRAAATAAKVVQPAAKRGVLGTMLVGWQMYRKVAPVVQALIRKR